MSSTQATNPNKEVFTAEGGGDIGTGTFVPATTAHLNFGVGQQEINNSSTVAPASALLPNNENAAHLNFGGGRKEGNDAPVFGNRDMLEKLKAGGMVGGAGLPKLNGKNNVVPFTRKEETTSNSNNTPQSPSPDSAGNISSPEARESEVAVLPRATEVPQSQETQEEANNIAPFAAREIDPESPKSKKARDIAFSALAKIFPGGGLSNPVKDVFGSQEIANQNYNTAQKQAA